MNTSQTGNENTGRGLEKCGKWRLLREIGRGAYGAVHLAQAPDGQCAAVKVCRRADVESERYARELRGVKLYMSVSASEGLVRMREVVEEDWGFYSVMALADDEFGRAKVSPGSYRPKTLAKVIDGEKALPLKECVQLGIALSEGLATLQRHHLLHRDIKPGNVVYIGGKPVLSDPGLLIEESEAASLVGTPGYVPPEKFTDPASDIYSLGLTLKAASFGRSIEELDKGPAQEADTQSPAFPAWWRILNKATDPVPSRRYQSAKALLKELKSLRTHMKAASLVRSWMLYVTIGAVLSLAAAYMMVSHREQNRLRGEIAPLKEFKGNIEENIEEAKRDAQWAALWIDSNPAYIYKDRVDWEIERVSATNETLGAELKMLINKVASLGDKHDARLAKIKSLHNTAREKMKKGLSDEKEFGQASRLKNENEMADKEIRSIYNKIFERLGVDR